MGRVGSNCRHPRSLETTGLGIEELDAPQNPTSTRNAADRARHGRGAGLVRRAAARFVCRNGGVRPPKFRNPASRRQADGGGQQDYGYDNAGNLTTVTVGSNVTTHSWDYAGRLI